MSGCWSGIPECFPSKCDICESSFEVESKQVPNHMKSHGNIDSFKQSNLCKKCQSEGWMLMTTEAWFFRLSYYNLKTQGFKHSK